MTDEKSVEKRAEEYCSSCGILLHEGYEHHPACGDSEAFPPIPEEG